VLSLDFDQDFALHGFVGLLKPRVTVVAVRNDLYERAQNVFPYRLIRLLEGNPIRIL
jgi:hypothetical protein